MTESRSLWIKAGYECFAYAGQSGLRIEALARKTGINKSSFYHYFADLDLYVDELLEHHIQQSKVIAEKERNAQSIDPDLIRIIVEHKTDILFNRQLRINRNHERMLKTLGKSNEIVGSDFILLWIRELGLTLTQKQLEGIFELALENFYLQVNVDNLTHQWISSYFHHLKKIVRNIVQSS